MTIAEFLTELNIDLIDDPDEELTLQTDIFEYLAMLGVLIIDYGSDE